MCNYASFMDSVFDDIISTLRNSDYSIIVSDKDVNSISESDVPYNQYIDEDKNLYFEFALAGVEKDLIDIKKTNNIISIMVKAKESKEKYAYTYKGIKFPKNKDFSIATIEITEKYNDKPEISYNDGLLKFKFTIKPEEKPETLSF